MKTTKTFLAILGFSTLVLATALTIMPKSALSNQTPAITPIKPMSVQRGFNLGDVLVKSVLVQEGLTPEDVIDSLKSLAVSREFLFVGEAPIHKQIAAVTGKPYRYTSILSFCDARIGKLMLDYKSAYAAFMPCRIALATDADGRLWLHTFNLGLVINGDEQLPAKVKAAALKVWATMQAIMAGAAQGDF